MKGAVVASCALLAAILVIAGCGGGDEATASLTHAQFIKQGNTVCKKGEEERGEVLQSAFKLLKPGEEIKKRADQEALVLTALIPQYKKMTTGLKDLGAPSGEQEKVDAIIRAMEATTKHVEDDPAEAFKTVKPFASPNKLNEEYGLTNCVI